MQPAQTSASTANWDISIIELAPNRITHKTWRTANALAEKWGNEMVWIEAGEKVEVELDIQLIEEGLLVSGQANTVAKAQCVRCLEQLEYDLQADINEIWLEPDKRAEILDDECDITEDMPVIEGSEINVESLVHDSLILEMPFQPLCSSDCLGLCAQCGMPYAELESNHKHEILDSRWAAISDWSGRQ